jgi:lipase chaperone LimK
MRHPWRRYQARLQPSTDGNERMVRSSKPLDLPPGIARAFVNDMKLFFAEEDKHRRDAIAVRQLRTLQEYQSPHEKKLRLDDVRQLFERMKYHA